MSGMSLEERIDYYRAYKEARVERYRERAAKARERSSAAYESSRRIASFIPPGQPVLVGHHSEKRHRRDIARIERGMRRSWDESEKAKYWERRAAAAEDNGAISSKDPEAITLIKARIAVLENHQSRMKAVNAAHKKYLKDPASLDKANLSDRTKEVVRAYKPQYSWEPHPYPPYCLSNNNANIRRLKERVASLERWAATPAAPEVETESGLTITEDADRNSVNIRFPDKPSEEVRKQLKAHGFRWSRSEGTWYARRSNRTTYALGLLFPELKKAE